MKTQAICPTCGSICEKGSSDEGTNYFIPKKIAGMKDEIEYLKEKIAHLERILVEVNILAAQSSDYAYSQRKVAEELKLLKSILIFIEEWAKKHFS